MPTEELELEFYRAVEDLFAAARGVPHVLSPKDFQLLRQWWSEGVPLQAVAAGVAEVVARRREAGAPEPVTSLRYCRHAVRKQAAHLAAMRAGESDTARAVPTEVDVSAAVVSLGRALRSRAAEIAPAEPAVARALEEVATLVEAAADLAAAQLESHLWALETTMLDRCWEALSADERNVVDGLARDIADRSTEAGARERAHRAARDRELRRRLRLPRLELPSRDPA